MKKLKVIVSASVRNFAYRWDCLPLKSQQQYIRIFFAAYILITVLVLIYDFSGQSAPENKIRIKHIKVPEIPGTNSPASLQDTVSIIIKNKVYERI